MVKYFLNFEKEVDNNQKVQVPNYLDYFSFVLTNADKRVMKEDSKDIDPEKFKSLGDIIKFYIEWLEDNHKITIKAKLLIQKLVF